jgi:hypothetical protein
MLIDAPQDGAGFAARRGKKRAILAVAHSLVVRAYGMSQRQDPYREAGADVFDRLQPEDTLGDWSNGWKSWAIT